MKNNKKNNNSVKEQGWEKRNITDAEKANEHVDIYKSLGFQVLVKTYDSKAHCDSECDKCLIVPGKECKVIYTRSSSKDSESSNHNNDFEELEDE